MINVLIVEDSLTTRKYLKHIIESDSGLRLVGEAKNGTEALALTARKRPNVIIMDIQMPGMNGYETTRTIMEKWPVPIVIHSALVSPDQTENIFQAMRAGAVAVSQKPAGIGHPESKALVEKLIRTIKLMAEVKVVRLHTSKQKPRPARPPLPVKTAENQAYGPELIAIGASTGGPSVLYEILSNLSKNHRTPIIVVQHISNGFLEGMLGWLSKQTHLKLIIAKTGEKIQNGCVYFAPEDHNIEITPSRSLLVHKISKTGGLKRPISHLFASAAKICGKNAIGVLLTGMGNDGAVGLREMKSRGALTIVQDRESAMVFGMPGEAIKLNAATYVLPPPEIASFLNAACTQDGFPETNPVITGA